MDNVECPTWAKKSPGWRGVGRAMKLRLRADFSEYQRKLAWISARLESVDVRERLDSGLLGRIKDSIAGVGGEELAKLGAMSADGAGGYTVNVEVAGLLEDIVLALRALGFEFHDDPVVGSIGDGVQVVAVFTPPVGAPVVCTVRVADDGSTGPTVLLTE